MSSVAEREDIIRSLRLSLQHRRLSSANGTLTKSADSAVKIVIAKNVFSNSAAVRKDASGISNGERRGTPMQNLVYEGVVTTLKSLGGDIFRERVMLSSGSHP